MVMFFRVPVFLKHLWRTATLQGVCHQPVLLAVAARRGSHCDKRIYAGWAEQIWIP